MAESFSSTPEVTSANIDFLDLLLDNGLISYDEACQILTQWGTKPIWDETNFDSLPPDSNAG